MLSLASTTVPAAGVHADILRGVGVAAAGVAGDAGNDFLGVAIDQAHVALGIQLHQREHVVGIDSAVRILRLPGLSGVVLQLIFLNPDAGVGEQIHAVGVVPVHVGDDDVGDVLGLRGREA